MVRDILQLPADADVEVVKVCCILEELDSPLAELAIVVVKPSN